MLNIAVPCWNLSNQNSGSELLRAISPRTDALGFGVR
jgi:hypothetical protein